MADKTNKELQDLAKIFNQISKDIKKNIKANNQVIDITSEQLNAIKGLTSGSVVKPVEEFFGVGFFDPRKGYRKILKESEQERQDFLDEQLEKEEKLAKLSQENSEEELDNMMMSLRANKKVKKQIKENGKEAERVEKEETARRSNSLKYFREASGEFLKTWDFIKYLPVVGEFISLFGQFFNLFENLIFQPLKGLFKVAMGIGSFVLGGAKAGIMGEKKEKQAELAEEQNDQIIQTLQNIDENTQKEKKMEKAGGIFGFISKLFPKNLFGGLLGGMTAGAVTGIGGTLLRLMGGAMIFGGIAMMINDFMKGFREGGIKGGLSQMFLGKLDGTVMSAVKNAGKFALLGAGIGSIFPVVGTIAGGIIGGAIGLVLNVAGSFFKSEKGAKLIAWTKEKLSNMWSSIKTATSKTIAWFSEVIPKLWDRIKNIFSGAFDSIKNFFSKLNPFRDDKPETTTKKSGGFMSGVKNFFFGDKKDVPEATSKTEMKTVEIQKTQKENTSKMLEKTIENNSFFEAAVKHLENIEKFLLNDMIGGIKNVLADNINALYRGMLQMNYTQRAYEAYQTGGISGIESYTQQYRQFSEDLMKLSKNKEFLSKSKGLNRK